MTLSVNKNKKLDVSVYLVTKPTDKVKGDYWGILEQALSSGVSILQWREKKGDTGNLYRHAKRVQKLSRDYQTPFIINDRLDLALALNADGLHVGQEDLPALIARRLLGPDKILGVSAGNLEEALKAEADGADYIGVGAVFPTGSKHDATSISMTEFKKITETVKIPVVAIGGISQDKVPLIMANGANGAAVISAVWDHPNPEKAVFDLKQAIETSSVKMR